MLNVARLRVLREVAERGSFSAAADALSYTQSAVSQQIAALEAETGMTLLERGSRGVRLTEAGRTLVEHAEGILARLTAAEEELAALAGLRGGQLRMASFPTAGATLMPVAIAAFRASYPEVQLTLAEGEPEEIAPRLRAGEFDLALLFEFPDTEDPLAQEPGRERLKRVELLEDPLYLALPRGHRAGREAHAAPGGAARGGVGADLAVEPLRAPRRALLPRRGVRAERGVRERRLPDRPGARGRGGGRRADPRARAHGRARGRRRARPLPQPAGAEA